MLLPRLLLCDEALEQSGSCVLCRAMLHYTGPSPCTCMAPPTHKAHITYESCLPLLIPFQAQP